MAIWFHVTTVRGNPLGSGWAPGECIWSPSANKRGSVAHYGIMLEARPGDKVIVCVNGNICGIASVFTACKEVTSGPPDCGTWSYAKSFFRVDLEDYVTFTTSVNLNKVAAQFKREIRQDMVTNRPTYYLYSWYPDSEFYPGGKLVLGQGRFLARATPVVIESVKQILSVKDRPHIPDVTSPA
jgi:hypothetical protein